MSEVLLAIVLVFQVIILIKLFNTKKVVKRSTKRTLKQPTKIVTILEKSNG